MRLGSVRLNKALWFADVFRYQATGESLSGEVYVKRQRGPVPQTILRTLEELQRDGAIRIEEPDFQYAPRKFFSLTPPQTNHLSEEECELAREVLKQILEYSAEEISEVTHDEVWRAAQEGEVIPLYATLASGSGEMTDEIKKWANDCIKEIKQSA